MAKQKEYVKDGTIVEATLVMFTAINNGTGLSYDEISDAATLQVFDGERDEFRNVEWDVSIKPPRLYYVD